MQGPGTQGGPEGEEPALLECPIVLVDSSLWGLACNLVRHRAYGRGPLCAPRVRPKAPHCQCPCPHLTVAQH